MSVPTAADYHAEHHTTVIIGDVVQTAWVEWHSDANLNEAASADVVLPRPTGPEVVDGAEVEITAAGTEDAAEVPVFAGSVQVLDDTIDDGGRVVAVRCIGHAYPLTLELETDLVFAGGAPLTPTLLATQVLHIGSRSVGWYADTTADGTLVNLTFSPAVDAHFVRLTGRTHGANSYEEEPDRDIRDWSRIEVWQAGHKRGYVNLPRSDERWRDTPNYLNDAEWDDLDVLIGARIERDEGDVTVKLIAGRKPGSRERDEYEVKGLAYQMAGRAAVDDLFRGLLRQRGYGPGRNNVAYRIAKVLDLNGNRVLLGGNGLIDNGRVGVTEGTPPWGWLTDTADLWGYAWDDAPHDLVLTAVRGRADDRAAVGSYVEGVNLFRVARRRDRGDVATAWIVYGASGTDENGQPFQYLSRADPAGISRPPYIPAIPGVVPGQVSSSLLVSDGLARGVRQVKETEFAAIPLALEFDCPPACAVRPGQAVDVTVPTWNLPTTRVWVTGVRHDCTDAGLWSQLKVRVGQGVKEPEDDPAVLPRDATLTSTRHIGVATVAWYRRPDPGGTTVTLDWHPGGNFRAVRVRGFYHGANSHPSGSKPDTWSRVEVWQLGTKLGDVRLPWHGEAWDRRRDYSTDQWWAPFDLTIAADLINAAAEIRFTSGLANDGSRDEYEIKDTSVVLYAEATEQGPVATSGADWHAYQPRRVFRWAS